MSTSQHFFRVLVFSLAGIILVGVGVGQLLADTWQVTTKRLLTASPEQVAALVNDFATWQKWSQADANLGPQTTRTVVGTAGAVGQQIVWSGPKGKATLTLSAATANSLDYQFNFQFAGEAAAPTPRGGGRVEWRAEGAGAEIRWVDSGAWDGLAGRWVGWFGALQEKVRQVQSSSLEALQQQLNEPAVPPTNK